jgi:hypothetical protein
MLKKEKEHLDNQIKRFSRIYESLGDRALYVLETLGADKLESENGHKISLRETSSVDVTDITKLPEWAVKTEVKVTPLKNEIKEKLKAGQPVPGATLNHKKYVVFK